MRVIATCSYIDLEMAKLATRFAKGDFTIIAGMLAPMRSARRDAINAAAEIAFSAKPDDQALYDGIVKRVESIKSRRDEYAHRLWATSPQTPDCLLLIRDKHLAALDAGAASRFANVMDKIKRAAKGNPKGQGALTKAIQVPFHSLDHANVDVYRKEEIQNAARARTAHDLVVLFNCTLNARLSVRARARDALVNELQSAKSP
ncbi:MAG: hypothetical protein LH467_06525 [Gemmatimonadaceae bacterium]|nr:hypothetical protein [Gemmatimonadaceae bacterium]